MVLMYFLARNVLPGKNTHLPSQRHLRTHRSMFCIALGQTYTSRRINKNAANKGPNVPLRAVQRSNPQLDRAKCVSRFSKSATIITFDSRKRSKRVEGNPHCCRHQDKLLARGRKNRCFYFKRAPKNSAHASISWGLRQRTIT